MNCDRMDRMVNRIGAPGGVASRAALILFTILFILSKGRCRCRYLKLTHYRVLAGGGRRPELEAG